MVRYFLTDLRGNPIYSFAQRLRRNAAHHNRNHQHQQQQQQRLSLQLLQQEQQRYNRRLSVDDPNSNDDTSPPAPSTTPTTAAPTVLETHSDFVTTTLVCMVRNRAWEDVLKRVLSHTHEVHLTDAVTGNTVLHVACRLNPPASVVTALATQATCRHANHEGATPLHICASHRCSGPAVQALLDACRRCCCYFSTTSSSSSFATNDSLKNDSANNNIMQHDNSNKHTSPTADLSRMGRAPIHYACMSFRGLEIDAFRLLLDATLQEGNVWVWDRQRSNHEEEELYGEMQRFPSSSSAVAFEKSDERDLCEFDYFEKENDVFEKDPDRNLCVQASDDLTVDDSKTNAQSAIKVLVNVMGIKDATGQTPLGLLFRRYRERVRCVINTVDRLRRDQNEHPELAAALRVHADLGELWEKARWIVARLTEERLQREQEEANAFDGNICSIAKNTDKVHDNPCTSRQNTRHSNDAPLNHRDATSRRATYFGSIAASFCETSKFAEPPSPAEAAVAHEAASWATEQHSGPPPQDDLLLLAPDVSTDRPDSPSSSTGRRFRIVHASVGLTGYGCPPELIRLAISIHPHQVMEMDEDGNLPLHIAVSAASYLATAHACRDDGYPSSIMAAVAAASDNTGDDHSVLSDAAMSFFSSATVSQTTNPFDKVIKILLQQYPEAARMSQGKSGKLPLVLAVESGRRTWADGIRTLLNAYPPALHNKKIIEPELYPDVLSLVARNTEQDCAFDFAGCSDFASLLPVVGEHVHEEGAAFTPLQAFNSSRRAGGRHRSKRDIRQDACSRTTLFELLRTKPEWLTRAFDTDPSLVGE